MNSKARIQSIRVERQLDDSADTSNLGKYTDNPTDGSIERATGEFYGDIERRWGLIDQLNDRIIEAENNVDDSTEHEVSKWIAVQQTRIARIEATGPCEHAPRNRNEFSYVTPYAGGEKWGSAEYRKYAKQDYDRLEGLGRGDWCYYGIIAKAEILIGDHLQTIRSGGLWEIESDCVEYHAEVAMDQLSDLSEQLEALGFGKRAIAYAVKQWNGELTDR